MTDFNNQKVKPWQVAIMGIIGLTIACYIGFNSAKEANTPHANIKPTPVENGLILSSYNLKCGYGFHYSIEGVVKNESRKSYKYAQVSFNVYDGTGSQVDSVMANMNNLDPGGSWKFDIPIFKDVSGLKVSVKDLSGF